MDLLSIETPLFAAQHKHEASSNSNGRWKVLVVDCNQTYLSALEQMLHSCNFNVTTCEEGKIALSMLREDRNRFDLVIAERNLPDMDGLEFLKHAGLLNIDLPVILMSPEDGEQALKEAFNNGACEYMVKPIRIEDARHIWKHAYRMLQKKNASKGVVEQSGSSNDRGPSDGEHTSDSECSKCLKRRRSKQLGGVLHEDDPPISARKKQRVIWTPDLHKKFVAAVNQFGISKAVPKKILENMNVPGLTRENVASHLQKYRQYQRRLEDHGRFEESIQHQNERAAAFVAHQEAQHLNKLSSPIDGQNLLAQTTLLGQQIVQAPSLMPQETGYRTLTVNPDSSSMFEYEMSQQVIKLESSDHYRDHQVNSTYEPKPTVPLLHQPVPEQSITKHGSAFFSSPSAYMETISIANPNGACYSGHESQVQMHILDDFVTKSDVSASSMFASFREMATHYTVEGDRYEQHGHEIVLEHGNDNKMYYPVSIPYPTMDSKLNETELPWDGVSNKRSFAAMDMTSIGVQCDYTSSGNFNHRMVNNSIEHGFDLGYDHVVDSLDPNVLKMELFEQQGVGIVQQVSNFPGGEE